MAPRMESTLGVPQHFSWSEIGSALLCFAPRGQGMMSKPGLSPEPDTLACLKSCLGLQRPPSRITTARPRFHLPVSIPLQQASVSGASTRLPWPYTPRRI